jgi:hypothetical protein
VHFLLLICLFIGAWTPRHRRCTLYGTSPRGKMGDPDERGTGRDPQRSGSARRVEDMAGRNDNRDTRGNVRGDVRGEIREFLSTRRARISPQQAGLPTYGGDRRRVSGLRREEVALLAGISSEYYTRLERGNATGVSDSVIDAIAHALQLDDAERTHLLDLLRTAGTTRPPRRRPARSASDPRCSASWTRWSARPRSCSTDAWTS